MGIELVLQGDAGEHHFHAWSFREFALAPKAQGVDERFDGVETFYYVAVRFGDGTESPASERVQYVP